MTRCGCGAALRAAEATRQVPILVLVQDSAQDRLVKALDLGINDYAVMPVDRNEIIARLPSQIRRKALQPTGSRARSSRAWPWRSPTG